MPELPEVETIRRGLEPQVVGRAVQRVEVRHAHVTAGMAPGPFARALPGRRVLRLWRRGKYLVFDLSAREGADPLHLVCHLRMTGRLCYLAPRRPWREAPAHTHALIRLEGGGRLVFYDVRKFGRLQLVPPAEVAAALPAGRDPVLEDISGPFLLEVLGGRQAPLKALLLRQDLVCGLGNIYADEALHRAGLHPAAPGRGLHPAEAERLAAGIQSVLREALAFSGTTLMDYRTGEGERGAFAQYLRVYGRAGRPCRQCGATIGTIRLSGRTTAFCPGCQPLAGQIGV